MPRWIKRLLVGLLRRLTDEEEFHPNEPITCIVGGEIKTGTILGIVGMKLHVMFTDGCRLISARDCVDKQQFGRYLKRAMKDARWEDGTTYSWDQP